ncbi:MAG: ABC transporter substrate-binding protein [Rhodobacteraceae bacterium]|nr:ABC transporter substrate-binding protein [Paracoccaceae bacterium]
MRNWKAFLASAGVAAALLGTPVLAQDEPAAPPLQDIPRDQTLILQNPEGTIRNPGWFNIWVPAGGGWTTGLHQLSMDTFWYIDPNEGIDGVTYNSLATGPAIYNDDYTEMTVELRPGVYWSDGVEFTAHDVVFTVEKQAETPGMNWSGVFSQQVESVEAVDDYTVHFTLKAPNSRFDSVFKVRWNAAWIMPKHIFEDVEDVLSFDNNPPVGLGPYTLHSYDPNGSWYIWEKREDWDRTAMAEYGEPAPQYVIYRDGGPTDRRLIEMRNGNLDMIHDLTPEGMFSIVQQDETARGWFDGFPYAHPDPTLPSVIFNHQNEKFQDRNVRWALALMLDGRAMSMASYRGAATMSAIAIPPTGTHPTDYHIPMNEWLTEFELDTGTSVIRPYDPDLTLGIADMVRPQYGDAVPSDPAEIRAAFGQGWWRQDIDAATELLTNAGFTRRGNNWIMPNGEPFAFSLMIPGDGVINRLGTMVAQNWTQAGVNVDVVVASDHADQRNAGNYDSYIWWSVETWGGHPDLSYFLDSWHSQYVADPGEIQPARNWQRWQHPELDRIIEEVRVTGFDDPRNLELGLDFVRLMVEEMPIIPVMSYNVFAVMSERYWTGYPSANNPYANPVNNWSNSRYILTQLERAGN